MGAADLFRHGLEGDGLRAIGEKQLASGAQGGGPALLWAESCTPY